MIFTKIMKTAEEWMQEQIRDKCGSDLRLVEIIPMIQLDAIKEGMRRAAEIAGTKIDSVNAKHPTPELCQQAILTSAETITL